MKALEDDADYKLKTLKENDLENKDIEEIKAKLKVDWFYSLHFWREATSTDYFARRHSSSKDYPPMNSFFGTLFCRLVL